MQSFLSRIWTRVVVSISYDDNHYTTGTSFRVFIEHRAGVLRPPPRPIFKTFRWIRHARHCRKSMDELISDVLPWTLSHGQASLYNTRTYQQQLCTDPRCSLPEAMNDRDEWRMRVWEIRARDKTWWWWWWWYIYIWVHRIPHQYLRLVWVTLQMMTSTRPVRLQLPHWKTCCTVLTRLSFGFFFFFW